jgi:hypothetical protein
MSAFDFNNADPQREVGALIPENTVCVVVASLRPGGHGPGGWLKPNKNGDCLMADFEFTVEGGDFDRRKFWGLFVTEGATEGQQKAANITRSKLRAMLESAYGIHPGDDSPDAVTRRQVAGWQAFDGLRFCAKVGVEKGTGEYKDKNVLKAAITPDERDYLNPGPQTAGATTAGAAVASATRAVGGAVASAGAAAGAAKPSWAQ